jgi:hypothetical protein
MTQLYELSCINCLTGWSGINCDNIECGDHGNSNTTYRLVCICEKPYNGVHCDRLETANIYHYYNKKVIDIIAYIENN